MSFRIKRFPDTILVNGRKCVLRRCDCGRDYYDDADCRPGRWRGTCLYCKMVPIPGGLDIVPRDMTLVLVESQV